MTRRVFTVGSLIPGRMIVKQAQAPLSTPKTVKKQANKIILLQNGRTFEISPIKGKLLDTALNQGAVLQYKCRKGTCGQCAVRVLEAQGLTKPNEKELNKLKEEIKNGFRLACQAEIL